MNALVNILNVVPPEGLLKAGLPPVQDDSKVDSEFGALLSLFGNIQNIESGNNLLFDGDLGVTKEDSSGIVLPGNTSTKFTDDSGKESDIKRIALIPSELLSNLLPMLMGAESVDSFGQGAVKDSDMVMPSIHLRLQENPAILMSDTPTDEQFLMEIDERQYSNLSNILPEKISTEESRRADNLTKLLPLHKTAYPEFRAASSVAAPDVAEPDIDSTDNLVPFKLAPEIQLGRPVHPTVVVPEKSLAFVEKDIKEIRITAFDGEALNKGIAGQGDEDLRTGVDENDLISSKDTESPTPQAVPSKLGNKNYPTYGPVNTKAEGDSGETPEMNTILEKASTVESPESEINSHTETGETVTIENKPTEGKTISTDSQMFHQKQMAEKTEPAAVRFILPAETVGKSLKNGRTVVIKMEPEHLGHIRLSLSSSGDILHGRMTVQSLEARAVVEANLTELHDQLSRQGIKLDSFQISLSGEQVGQRDFGKRSSSEFGLSGRNRGKFSTPLVSQFAGIIPDQRLYINATGVNWVA